MDRTGSGVSSESHTLESLPEPTSSNSEWFGHPRGLATLFFTEMWERFSYYGMRALLVLFMTDLIASGGLGMSDATATAVYGLYTFAVYAVALPGGWIADRVTGQRVPVLLCVLLLKRQFLPPLRLRTPKLQIKMRGEGPRRRHNSCLRRRAQKPRPTRTDSRERRRRQVHSEICES